MRAITQLQEEHRVLEAAVPQIEKLDATFQGADQVTEFLTVFMDRCHHGKEEQHLFRLLAARGVPKDEGLVRELLQEHGAIRRYLREIGGLLYSARTGEDPEAGRLLDERLALLTDLLKEHLRTEDEQLWPLAAQALQQEDDTDLLAGFAQIQEQQIGEQQYRKYLTWARHWAT